MQWNGHRPHKERETATGEAWGVIFQRSGACKARTESGWHRSEDNGADAAAGTRLLGSCGAAPRRCQHAAVRLGRSVRGPCVGATAIIPPGQRRPRGPTARTAAASSRGCACQLRQARKPQSTPPAGPGTPVTP